MGKNKSSSQQLKTAKSSKDAQVKAISSVKGGAITKPSQTPKSKSKEIAKVVALKADKATNGDKKSKKAKKEPTPEPSSSEAEIDEAVTSASSESSGEESESETEPVQAAAKSNGTKANGSAKASTIVKATEESSESSASSDDEDDEEDDEDDDENDSEDDRHKPIIPNPVPVDVKKNGAEKHESGSEEDSEEDSEGLSEEDKEVDSDEESDAVPGAADPKGLNGATKKVETQQSSDDNSDSEASSGSESGTDADSDSDKSLGEDIQEEAVASKKRKADIDPSPTVKKSKTEATGGDATKKNLFVGQLSWNVDEDWLTREFEPYGELTGVRIITDRNTGRSKGFGYVEFANSADAIKAQEEKHGASIDNRVINVDFSNPRADESSGYKERSKSHGDEKSPPSDTIFVANIPFGATEDMLGEEFGKHGSVIGIRLPTNPDDGRPKGFGYVQFSSVDEASEALKNMEGAFIGGRPLRLDFSTPRTNTGDSPRGSRGGRGGGRGFDRGRGGGGRGRGGFGGDRGGRGGRGGGRGGSTNRGGFGDFKGKKMTFN